MRPTSIARRRRPGGRIVSHRLRCPSWHVESLILFRLGDFHNHKSAACGIIPGPRDRSIRSPSMRFHRKHSGVRSPSRFDPTSSRPISRKIPARTSMSRSSWVIRFAAGRAHLLSRATPGRGREPKRIPDQPSAFSLMKSEQQGIVVVRFPRAAVAEAEHRANPERTAPSRHG